MPTKLAAISAGVANRAADVGEQIRAHRKSLKVSATTAAEAAGMSRVTWYRIEKGATSVTFGALLSALTVLGLDLQIVQAAGNNLNADHEQNNTHSIPVQIALIKYPKLKQLAWQVHGVDTVSPREALNIYERNWRHLDIDTMEVHERNLVNALRQVLTGATSDV